MIQVTDIFVGLESEEYLLLQGIVKVESRNGMNEYQVSCYH